MGYAVEGDIRRHLGPTFSDNWPPPSGKPPTIADGIAFADAASGQIDAILSARGADIPVAAPTSFVQHLRDMAAKYAAALVVGALVPSLANAREDDVRDHADFLMRSWLDDIGALRTDGVPDAAVLTSAGGMGRSLWTSHAGSKGEDLDDGTEHNTTDPWFRRDTPW